MVRYRASKMLARAVFKACNPKQWISKGEYLQAESLFNNSAACPHRIKRIALRRWRTRLCMNEFRLRRTPS